MTAEQVPADERTAQDYRNWTKPELCRLAAKLHNELLEAKRSLRREDNARAIAVKDADRYRWLKPRISGREWRCLGIHYDVSDQIDSLVDAAMGKQS